MDEILFPTVKLEEIYNDIFNQVHNKNHIFLYGKTGTGKTKLIETLASNVDGSILFPITLSSSDRKINFGVWSRLFLLTHNENEEIISTNPQKSHLTTSILSTFISTEKNLGDAKIISEEELSYFYILEYLHKKTNLQLLLMCDDIDNWDDHSLFLLEKIVNKNPVLTTLFSFISNTTFLFSQRNDEPYFSFQFSEVIHMELTRPKLNELNNIMTFFGCEKKLTDDNIENLYRASMKGHLALIHQLSQDINKHNESYEVSYTNDVNFINNQLENNLELKNLIKTISVIDNDMWGKEVLYMMQDLYQAPRFEIDKSINQAVKNNYIETSPENYFCERTILKFTHNALQEYVKPKSNLLKCKYYNSYANSLVYTQPLDFMTRSVYHSYGGDYHFSDVLKIKHNLEIRHFNTSLIEFKYDESYEILKKLKKLTILYNEKKFKETLRYADNIISSNKLHDLLLFEVEYIKANVFSTLINDSSFNKSIELLEKWKNSTIAQKELDIHFKSSYRLIRNYLYLQRKSDVETLYETTKNKIELYTNYSQKAKNLSNILCRSSTIAYGLDSSYHILKNNLLKLGDINTNTPSSDYIQYYYSLINLSDVCAYLGKYTEGKYYADLALKFQEKSIHNLTNYSALNNYVINSICQEKKSVINNVKLMKSIVKNYSILQDNIILSTNLASLYISCGKFEKADKLFNEIFKTIKGHNYKVNNHIYKVTVNFATLKFLQGNSEYAIKLLKSIEGTYLDTYSNEFISTRHNNLVIIFKNLKMKSLNELDSYLKLNHNNDMEWYDEWMHYNQGLIWWGIQHWSFS